VVAVDASRSVDVVAAGVRGGDGGAAGGGRQRDAKNRQLHDLICAKHFESPLSRP
jgi:hypothetical protein